MKTSTRVMRLSSAEAALIPIVTTLRRYILAEKLLQASARKSFSFPITDFTSFAMMIIERWMSELSVEEVAIIEANHNFESDLFVEATKNSLVQRCLRQLPATRIVHITRRHRVLREKKNRLPKPRN
jgi:hypothetical protein